MKVYLIPITILMKIAKFKTPDSKIEYNRLKKFKTRINSWNQIVPPLYSIVSQGYFTPPAVVDMKKNFFFIFYRLFFFWSKIEMPETSSFRERKKIVNISVGLLSSSPKAIFCRKYLVAAVGHLEKYHPYLRKYYT